MADFASAGPPIKLGVPWALPVNGRRGGAAGGGGGGGREVVGLHLVFFPAQNIQSLFLKA